MIEMKSDVMRRSSLSQASIQARKDDFDYSMHRTMDERLGDMRAKQSRPKRKIPWFTIITVVTTIPFLIGGGMPSIGKVASQASTSGNIGNAQIQQAISTMQQHAPNQNAKVSIEIGGKVIQREISINDLKALQGQ